VKRPKLKVNGKRVKVEVEYLPTMLTLSYLTGIGHASGPTIIIRPERK
jgi:hypothetical protein